MTVLAAAGKCLYAASKPDLAHLCHQGSHHIVLHLATRSWGRRQETQEVQGLQQEVY